AQRRRRLLGDDHVPPAYEQRARGDDQDAARRAHEAGAVTGAPSRRRTTRAGTPTATAPSGRSPVTTAFAPTTTSLPIVTPSRTFAPVPSHTLRPRVIPRETRSCSITGRSAASNSWPPPTR